MAASNVLAAPMPGVGLLEGSRNGNVLANAQMRLTVRWGNASDAAERKGCDE